VKRVDHFHTRKNKQILALRHLIDPQLHTKLDLNMVPQRQPTLNEVQPYGSTIPAISSSTRGFGAWWPVLYQHAAPSECERNATLVAAMVASESQRRAQTGSPTNEAGTEQTEMRNPLEKTRHFLTRGRRMPPEPARIRGGASSSRRREGELWNG
jgi:hypothetical protein